MSPPQESIYPVLDHFLPKLNEGDILFITSKILAIHQGRSVKIGSVQKDKLIIQEAERYILGPKFQDKRFYLTIKDHTLIPTAGIDESNSNGYYTLWPKHTNNLLKELRKYLLKKFSLTKLGVIATDSHTTPLRTGTMGISIGFAGFYPTKDYRGKKDIFGRKLLYTRTNVVDAITAMAVLQMGEGREQTPLAILRGAKFIRFTNTDRYGDLVFPPQSDMYAPLLKAFKKSPKR